MNAPLHFKQQLADELHARATTLAAPTGARAKVRAPRRRLTFTLGAVVAAAAAVAVAVPLAGGTPGKQASANASTWNGSSLDIVTTDYSVKSTSDGTVAVTLVHPQGMAALDAALHKAGIPAAVMEFSTSCHAKVDYDNNIDPQKVFPQSANGRVALIQPSAIPKGEFVLIGEMMTPVGGLVPSSLSVVHQVPTCLSASYNDIGGGYVAPGTQP